ncbi:MAG: sulfotransferase [Rubrobacter sp.]
MERGESTCLPTRRFHLVGVGLPKTGTTSLAHLFQPFRWGDEFHFAESVERLVHWRAGRLDRDCMRRWLALRAEAGALELDAISFNHYLLDILIELNPTARFVYARRDAVSWADSFLNMVLRHGAYLRGRPWPEWQLGARQANCSQLRSRPVHLPRSSLPRASAARGGTAGVLCARDGPHRGRSSTREIAGDRHRRLV